MLKNTLEKKKLKKKIIYIYIVFLSEDNLIMNIYIMPKIFITNIFFCLNKRSDHKNDDPQQSNIFI